MRLRTPPLVRRRVVALPTLWGGLVGSALVVALLVPLARNAYGLFVPEVPARGPDGQGARTLVVEGWMGPSELDQVAAQVASRGYRRVLTGGGPIEPWQDVGGWASYAERSAAQLRPRLPAAVPVIAVPAPESLRERTYVSALAVRAWLEAAEPGVPPIDLVTSGAHARRSWLLYRMAFGGRSEVGVVSTRQEGFDADHWWRSSAGTKALVGELIGFAWTKCCFWPDEAAGD